MVTKFFPGQLDTWKITEHCFFYHVFVIEAFVILDGVL